MERKSFADQMKDLGLNANARRQLQARLLRWFDRVRRDLPWRASRDAYPIWISEVMLQQTTVAAVIPFFLRFMTAFPTVTHLAEAKQEAVLKHWQGLGYYRRAKHLHEAAKIIVNDYGGAFPLDPDDAIRLPGVGRYILGAVLSQAYEAKLPIVEANSLRVLARLFAYEGDPREGEGARWVWHAAESLLPSKRVGDFNQALMELGSQVCKIRTPDCGACPLKKDCLAFQSDRQESIPPPKKQKTVMAVKEIAVVVERKNKYLLCQLPADAPRWAGMWEFPRGESADAADFIKVLMDFDIHNVTMLTVIRHTVTRFNIELTVYHADAESEDAISTHYQKLKWCSPRQLLALPMSTPQRAIANLLVNQVRKHRT